MVTGAGKRLGRAMALYLAGAGMMWRCTTPSCAMRRGGRGEIRAMGRRAVTLQADLLDEAHAKRLLPALPQALGGR